jgi:hypothetical protein
LRRTINSLLASSGAEPESEPIVSKLTGQLKRSRSALTRCVSSVANGEKQEVDISPTPKYPLLEGFLAHQNLPLKPMYTNSEVAKIFQVCVRAIQNWITAGRLVPRTLPGRGKFFPQDLEEFLQNSQKGRQ